MSMTLGIVGSEQAKFTSETEAKARATIRTLIAQYQSSLVVSGGCHLGGVDLYALWRAVSQAPPEVQAMGRGL